MEIVFNSTFTIADDVSLFLKVLDVEQLSLQQQTQETQRVRAAWPTFFSDRASRSIPLVYPVQYPPCASVELAMKEARTVLATCPKGGPLTEQIGGTLITYEDAKLDGITVDRRGISNFFTFSLTAINPDTTALNPLAQMDARFKLNLNAAPFSITGLTGGTTGKLDSLATTDADLGVKGELFFLLGSVYVTKTFQLVTKATAATVTGGDGSENTDPSAGSLIIQPDDYHASTNDKTWLEVL